MKNLVLVTYWNENNNKEMQVEYVSTWDKESILEDSTTFLEGQTDWNNKNSGLNLLKEYDGKFDWFEITKIITK